MRRRGAADAAEREREREREALQALTICWASTAINLRRIKEWGVKQRALQTAAATDSQVCWTSIDAALPRVRRA
eukprot:352670-Chlamydomonas_euryale.AAC.4